MFCDASVSKKAFINLPQVATQLPEITKSESTACGIPEQQIANEIDENFSYEEEVIEQDYKMLDNNY